MRAHPPASPRTRSAAVAALVLLLAALAVTVASPAQAATRTVTLSGSGPVPARLVLAKGDRVRFTNADSVPHRVVSGKGWRYDSGTLAPGATSSLTPALSTPGTYAYTDTRLLVVAVATYQGSLVVPAPAPSPTRSRAASPPSSPRPSASPAPAPVATATPVLPLVPTGFPTAPPAAPSPLPLPAIGPPVTSAPPSPAPDLRYGDPQALVQGSPHRYGLPALLGLVGIAGVASLLLRVLLSMAPATRRTGED